MDLNLNTSYDNSALNNESLIISVSDHNQKENHNKTQTKNIIVKRINDNNNQNNCVDNNQNPIKVNKSSDRNAINFMGIY